MAGVFFWHQSFPTTVGLKLALGKKDESFWRKRVISTFHILISRSRPLLYALIFITLFLLFTSNDVRGAPLDSPLQYTIDGIFRFPLASYSVVQSFGNYANGGYHLGEDASASTGTPVYAAANGTVKLLYTGTTCGDYGHAIAIEHQLPSGDPYGSYVTTIYGHLASNFQVSYGDVSRGQLIGYIAAQGNDNGCWAPHLHFGVRKGPYNGIIHGIGPYSELSDYWQPTDFVNNHAGSGGVPRPPSNLSASAVASYQINLSWTASPDPIDGYKIYRNGTLIANWNTTTSFSNSGLASCTTYSYYITAYKGSTESSPSNTASATTLGCGGNPPTTPSSPYPSDYSTLSRTNNTTFYWNTDGTSCAIHIWGGSINITPGGSCGSLFLGQQYGGSYQWQVTAYNSYGSTIGPTWHFYIQPYGPTNLQVNIATSNQINLLWTRSSDDPGGVDSYKVYYSNGTLIDTLGAGSNTDWVGGLSCGSSYSFYVTAVRQGVESNPSNQVNGSTQPCAQAPTAPSNVRVSGTSANSITLAWDDVSNNEDGFKIYQWNGSYWAYLTSVSANSTSYVISALNCNIYYSHAVSAYNSYGESQLYGASATTQACPPSVPNDDLNAPIDMYLSPYNNTQNTSGATNTSDDPTLCAGGTGSHTVWYRFIPSSNGTLNANTIGSGYDTVLGVWYGTRGRLTRVACDDDAGGNLTSSLNAILNAGTTYYIEVASYSTTSGGNLSISLTYTIPNDDINGAILINGTPYSNTQNTIYATSASDDPNLCTPNASRLAGSRTVWYRFTPNSNGTMNANTIGSTYDTVLAVWTGTRGNLVSISCDDDSGGNYTSALSANVNGGITYNIEAAGYSVSDGGILSLAVNFASTQLTPANDDFNSTKVITATPYSDTEDTTNATTASDDPLFTCGNRSQGSASVWYRFTPSRNGRLTVNTIGSNYDTMLQVWRGTRGSLINLACDDDSGGSLTSSLQVNLPGGTTYYVEIARFTAGLAPMKVTYRPAAGGGALILSVRFDTNWIYLPMIQR